MLKTVIVVHRYLGVLLGVLMTVWCLSGFVMMYQGFPSATPDERLAGLSRLNLSACCDAPLPIDDEAEVRSFRVEAVADRPVIRINSNQANGAFWLDTGEPLAPLDRQTIQTTVERFAVSNERNGALRDLEVIRVDQWTTAIWKRQAPLWRARFEDPQSSYIYVSGSTGEVVQDATGRERAISWFGAIPHWLYPTLLRANAPVWTQVVIWSALLGVFLTVTGLVVGVARLRGRSGRWFPYRRPMWLWHHVLGTFAGILVLTWTFSGLLTMQPWGLFESKPSITRAELTGAMTGRDVRAMLSVARDLSAMGDLVQVRSAPLLGDPRAVLRWRDGSEVRIGASDTAPLDLPTLRERLETAPEPLSTAKLDLLQTEDAYYYGHKRDARLPVIRLRLPDDTRVYLDADTGEVRRIADATAKRYRWLESAFHSFDWPGIRARPIWDLIVLPLLLAVTLACATGAWLSITRVGQDVSGLRRRLRKSRNRRPD